jgi:hypothetical protein
MLKSKLIILVAISFSLLGCDQVRDKLVNGFNWNSSRANSFNNNDSFVNSEFNQQKKVVTAVDDQPNQPQSTPKQISNIVKSPIPINAIPNNKPKVAPEIQPKDTNGFKDNDW